MPTTANVAAALGFFVAFVACSHAAEERQDAQCAEQSAQQPRARDAAEAVQEGNVTRWLEHYQRERGEEWARDRGAPAPAAPDPAPAPVQQDE